MKRLLITLALLPLLGLCWCGETTPFKKEWECHSGRWFYWDYPAGWVMSDASCTQQEVKR